MKNNKRFWQVKNSLSGYEILLYDEIIPGSDWLWEKEKGTDAEFADALKECGGADVTVRINSTGGDVFVAHAVYNQLVSYKGHVKVQIDGVAASAASIVAMAGDEIIVPVNGMIMIHNPMMYMGGYCGASELVQRAEALEKIKDTIIAVYAKRTGLDSGDIAEMMDRETWMMAAECKEKGFADTVEDIAVSASLARNVANKRPQTGQADRKERIMDKKDEFFNALKEFFKGGEPETGKEKELTPDDIAKNVVAKERARVEALDALGKGGNAAVAAIIDTAKRDGRTTEDVKPFVDAVNDVPVVTAAAGLVADMVEDNHSSGVDDIKPGGGEKGNMEEIAIQRAIDSMAAIMSKRAGGK